MINFRKRRRGDDFLLLSTRFMQLSFKFQNLSFQILEFDSIVDSIFFRVLKIYREFFDLLFVLEGLFLIDVALKKQRTIILDYNRKETISFFFFDDIFNRFFKFSEVLDFQRNEMIYLKTRV